jgi:hypothetical protein
MSETINETGEPTTPLSLGKPSTTAPAPAPATATVTEGNSSGDASLDAGVGPRIRWAGIIWGLIVSAIAVAVLAITGSAFGRTAFLDWAASLTAATVWLLVVLVAGALLLIFGLLALLRRRA